MLRVGLVVALVFVPWLVDCGTPATVPDKPVVSVPVPASASATSASAKVATPGTVMCGAASCDLARQHCCKGAQGDARCVDKPSDDTNPCGDDERLACDDLSDCSAGERCCSTYACTSGCPREQLCEKNFCAFGPEEVCLAGGECGPGFSCAAAAGSQTGTCSVDRKPLSCGATTCSEIETCCWDGSTATCATECLMQPGHDSFGCFNKDDCGGYTCGDFAGAPFGMFACRDVGADRSATILCRQASDCPVHHGAQPTGCVPYTNSMPGLQACAYE